MRRSPSILANFRFSFRFAAMMLGLIAAAVCVAADAPSDAAKADSAKADTSKDTLKVIKPEDAKDYEGQAVIVEFTVAAARELDSGVCFLNSTTDRNDPAGFTAFISKPGMDKFKENPATAKPAELFDKKKIRVTGKIVTYQKKYEIKVDDTDQIEIVEEKADANAEKKS